MSPLKPPIPKEHGSWAMLGVPLLIGFIVASVWNWQSLVLIMAALGFFLVRYPLAVLVKTRKRSNTDRAYLWRWTLIYGSITALCVVWLVLARQLWLLIPMGLLGGLLLAFHLWLVARRQEMSVVGELAGILGLTLGAPMAYYTASEQMDLTALILWVVNALYFGGTVFYIKLKVRQQPRQPAPPQLSERLVRAKACLGYQTVTLTVVLLLVTLRLVPLVTPLALIPATVKVLWGAGHWQEKESLSLMRLGIVEIFHALAFMVLIVIAFL